MRIIFILFFILVALAIFAFWIWTIVDGIRNPLLNDSKRILWVIIIVLLGILGSILYLLLAPRSGRQS